jgi:hypothetical protein
MLLPVVCGNTVAVHRWCLFDQWRHRIDRIWVYTFNHFQLLFLHQVITHPRMPTLTQSLEPNTSTYIYTCTYMYVTPKYSHLIAHLCMWSCILYMHCVDEGI